SETLLIFNDENLHGAPACRHCAASVGQHRAESVTRCTNHGAGQAGASRQRLEWSSVSHACVETDTRKASSRRRSSQACLPERILRMATGIRQVIALGCMSGGAGDRRTGPGTDAFVFMAKPAGSPRRIPTPIYPCQSSRTESMVRYATLLATALIASPLLAQTPGQSYAQHLVDETLATHPDIAIMAMHVTPPKQADNVIIASNIGRIGKKADSDDMGVVDTGKPVLEVNKEGDHFEVELPLQDVTSDTVGALSIVFPYNAGDDKAALAKRAEVVRDALRRKISNVGNLTQPYQFDPTIPTHTYAQQLVDQTMAAHPKLLILMLHIVPPGKSTNVVVGTSIGRFGKPADDDDMRAINTGIPNLEVNGRRFEVETRLLDASGKTLGAVGIVFPYKPGDDKEALKREGFAIRDELRAKIPTLAKLMEPVAPVAVTDPHPTATLIGRSTDWHPGYSGDFDHFGVDVKGNRLFLAAEDHGSVELFNLKTGQHERTLDGIGTQTPHAFVYLPGRNRLIITDSGKSMSRILDATTLKVVGHINLAPGADSAEYDPSTGRLYIVTGGKDVGMKDCFLNEVDPLTGHVYAKLKFDSDHVEAVRAEQHGDRLFVNV